MNILILSDYFPPNVVGGAELVAWNQYNALVNQGHQVFVVTKSGNEYSTVEENIFRISFKPNLMQNTIECVIKIHDTFKIDFVFAHNMREIGNDSLAYFQNLKIPTKVKLHDFHALCHRGTLSGSNGANCDQNPDTNCFCRDQFGALELRMKRDLVRYASQNTVEFTTPSKFYKNVYERFGILVARHESNGILEFPKHADVQLSTMCSCPTEDHTRFVFSGYLGKHKGIDLIIHVFSRIFEEYSGRCCLTIAGDGDEVNRINKFAKKYKKSVHVLGRISPKESDDLIGLSDCLILPSIWPENEPVSILQALSKGKQVVSSDSGGNIELYHSNLSSIFVSGDEEGFKRALEETMNRAKDSDDKKSISQDLSNRLSKQLDHFNFGSHTIENPPPHPLVIILGNTRSIPKDFQSDLENAFNKLFFISSDSYLAQASYGDFYIVISPEFRKRLLSHALKSGKTIFTPRVSDFNLAWDSPKDGLFQFGSTEELISLLHSSILHESSMNTKNILLRDHLARSLEDQIFMEELL